MSKPLYKFQIEKGVDNKGQSGIDAEKAERAELEKTLGLKNCESVYFVNNDSRHVPLDFYWLEPNLQVGEEQGKQDPWGYKALITKITRYVTFNSVKERIMSLQREIKYLRAYGNKDCIAQAEQAMQEKTLDE